MAGEYKLYHYDPTIVGAILFIALFVVTTALHSYQLVRTRAWFMIPLAIGGYCFIGRAMAHYETPDWTLGPYVMQTLLLLLAPALFAASIYMSLGRIIELTEGEHLALIKRKWLTKIFVTGDVISFVVQGGGGGIMAGGDAHKQKVGSNIIVVGLFIQLAFFGFFVVVAGSYDLALRRKPTRHTMAARSPWHKHLISLYGTSTLILIRSVFRAIEYLQGNNGYLLGHEVFLYIFDAVLMVVVMVVFNILHPSEIKAWLRGGRYVKKVLHIVELRKEDGYQMS